MESKYYFVNIFFWKGQTHMQTYIHTYVKACDCVWHIEFNVIWFLTVGHGQKSMKTTDSTQGQYLW